MDEQPQPVAAKSSNAVAIPAAIVIAGGLIALAVFFSGRGPVTPAVATTPTQPTRPPIDPSKIKTEGEPFIGQANAPATIFEWFDYQCPYCKQVEESTLPQIVDTYVKSGKVKLVYKDFQFLGPDSQTAALASRAVWEVNPGKFYDWHKALFDKQDSENSGWGSKDDVAALLKTTLGASDAAAIQQVMTNKASEYQKAIDADKTEGQTLGVTGTPSFVIGKQLIPGVVGYDQFQQAIKAAS